MHELCNTNNFGGMASHDELKSALMETLEKRGVVGELKAKIRQEIFSVLDENDVAKPKVFY